MPGWEIGILVGGAVLGFGLAMFFEREVYDRVLRLVAGSVWRGFGLLVTVLLIGLGLAVILINTLPALYQSAPTVIVLGTALVFTGTMVVITPFFPGVGPSISGAGSSRSDLHEEGASGIVSIVLGWGGALVALILFGFLVLSPALVLIDP